MRNLRHSHAKFRRIQSVSFQWDADRQLVQLCCDGGTAIKPLAWRAKLTFHGLPAPGSPRPEAPDLHINNVNAYHGGQKQWLRRFHGVGTAKLPQLAQNHRSLWSRLIPGGVGHGRREIGTLTTRFAIRVNSFSCIAAMSIDTGASFFRIIHNLVVHDTGSSARQSVDWLAALNVQRMIYCVQRAIVVPVTQVAMQRASRRYILRHIPPLAARAADAHDAADQCPIVALALASTQLVERDQRPYLIGQVARVAQLIPVVSNTVPIYLHLASRESVPSMSSQAIQ